MEIAVYGDSYANLNLSQPNDGRGQSWIDVLSKQHNVTNFGLGATSIYWSYQKFIENNSQFDYNIFIITHPDRIYNRKLDDLLGQNSWYTNYAHIKFWEKASHKRKKDYSTIKVIDSVKTYFEFWKDEETENVLNIALIENLMYKYDNCLFINAFSKKQCPLLTNEFGLCDITEMELIGTGWIEKYVNKGIHMGHLNKDNYLLDDYRLNHLSEENNIILGNKITEAVNKKKKMLEIKLEDFVVPKHDIDFYVKWIKQQYE